jgi:hypothetical protein
MVDAAYDELYGFLRPRQENECRPGERSSRPRSEYVEGVNDLRPLLPHPLSTCG